MTNSEVLIGSLMIGVAYTAYLFPTYLKDLDEEKHHHSYNRLTFTELVTAPIITSFLVCGIHNMFFE
jgi:hypothetical protein